MHADVSQSEGLNTFLPSRLKTAPTGKPMIIAIDPGGTTGVAVRLDTGVCVTATYSDYGEGNKFEFWRFLQNNTTPRETIVVCERFYAGGRIGSPGENTLQLIGAIKAICWLRPVDLVMRTPQQRLAWTTEARKQLQATRLPFVIHEMDSLAHLLSYEWQQSKKVGAKR